MSIKELKELQQHIIINNRKCNIIINFVTLILGVVTFALTYYFDLDGCIETTCFVVIISFMFGFMVIKRNVHKDMKLYSDNFKSVFVLGTLNTIFTDVVYKPNEGIKDFPLIDTGSKFDTDDYISAKYKNINFEQCDARIQRYESDFSGDYELETVFFGRLMSFDFNKKFKANVQVSSKYFDVDKLPRFHDFSEIKLEDVDFNEEFIVFAEDEHDAFYILTPHFMDKIKKLKEKLEKPIMFCFVDNRLYVAIDTWSDAFECDPLELINEKEIKNEMLKDIKLITDLVDDLVLTDDVFRKEI